MDTTTLTDFCNREEKYSLLLGAGFSKWALGLPIVSELFDFKIRIWGVREKKRLDEIMKLKESWDSTNLDRNPEEFITYAYEGSEKDKFLITWYITRRLSDPFICEENGIFYSRRHILMIDEYRKNKIPGLIKAKKFFNFHMSPMLAGIITTNYDLVIEYSLGSKGFNYGQKDQILQGRGPYPVSQWKNPVMLKGDLPVAKLHGSISWTDKGYHTDGRGGLTGKALIVPPTQNKSEIDFFDKSWNLAKEILENSSKIIAFGFSFNQNDKKVLDLLSETREWIREVIENFE